MKRRLVPIVVLLGLMVAQPVPRASALTVNGCEIKPLTQCPGANLSGAQLNGANLSSANLAGVDLSGASLVGAQLNGANLRGALLTRANLASANLIGATLSGANLSRAELLAANLIDAVLDKANLSGARLARAFMARVDLREANLTGTNLVVAALGSANLSRANMSQAVVVGTELIEANLSGVNLVGAKLNNAILNGANLRGADLTGANLIAATLNGVNLTRAVLCGTRLPDGALDNRDCGKTPKTPTTGTTPSVAVGTADHGLTPTSRRGFFAVLTVGQVMDQTGVGVAGARVEATPSVRLTMSNATTCPSSEEPLPSPSPAALVRASESITSTTGPDGSFRLGLSSGAWDVVVTADGYFSGAQAATSVTVNSDVETVPTLVLLRPTQIIRGTVRNGQGVSLSSGQVQAEGVRTRSDGSVDEFLWTSPIGSDGSYSVPVVDGVWSVTAQVPTSALSAGVANITIRPTTPVTTLDLTLPSPTGQITGLLRDASGQVVTDTNTFLVAQVSGGAVNSPVLVSTTNLNNDGSFSLPAVIGNWDLEVSPPPSYLPLFQSSLAVDGSSGPAVALTLLRPTSCVRGQITRGGGQPAVDAFVLAVSVTPGQSGTSVSFAEPDDSGNYAVPVAEGSWEIIVPGARPDTQTISVPPDANGVNFRIPD